MPGIPVWMATGPFLHVDPGDPAAEAAGNPPDLPGAQAFKAVEADHRGGTAGASDGGRGKTNACGVPERVTPGLECRDPV